MYKFDVSVVESKIYLISGLLINQVFNIFISSLIFLFVENFSCSRAFYSSIVLYSILWYSIIFYGIIYCSVVFYIIL